MTCPSLSPLFIPRLLDDSDLEVFHFSSYGKDLMKAAKCSPDAFVQLVLQLARFK